MSAVVTLPREMKETGGFTWIRDIVPVKDIRRFEAEFLDFLGSKHSTIFETIVKSGKLEAESPAQVAAKLKQMGYAPVSITKSGGGVNTEIKIPGFGKPKAWDFLDSLYGIPGIKRDFDAAALHPYAPNIDELVSSIEKFRASMRLPMSAWTAA